jgi:FixJ family two-component response regulator
MYAPNDPHEEAYRSVEEAEAATETAVSRASASRALAARTEWSARPSHSNQPSGNWADNPAAALVRMEPSGSALVNRGAQLRTLSRADDLGTRSTPMPRVKSVVFVVDDDVSVRDSLEALIREEGWQPKTFPSAQEFLSYPRVPGPSCLVLDVSLPDVNGLDLQRRVAEDRTDIPIIFITGHSDVPVSVQAMKAGALEFLTKPFGDEVLLTAIRHAIECSKVVLAQEAEISGLQGCYALLSRREQEVMALVVSGFLNKQVGQELGISEITVKAHRGKVMRKMKAGSLPDLVNMAARLQPARYLI